MKATKPGGDDSGSLPRDEETLRMAPDATPFRRLVDSLPVEQGQALDLRIGQRMTLASIAEQMGKTPAQVARLLRQGLGELRDKLP